MKFSKRGVQNFKWWIAQLKIVDFNLLFHFLLIIFFSEQAHRNLKLFCIYKFIFGLVCLCLINVKTAEPIKTNLTRHIDIKGTIKIWIIWMCRKTNLKLCFIQKRNVKCFSLMIKVTKFWKSLCKKKNLNVWFFR